MAPKHQLAQLIDGVKSANGWSDPDLVHNAKEKGYVLSKSNIARYRKPVVSIKGEVILALAAGLRVTPAQVAVATIESMGIHLPSYDAPTPEQAVRLDTKLSARDKQSVLALLAHLRTSSSSSGASDAAEGQEGDRSSDDTEPGPTDAGVDAAARVAEVKFDDGVDGAKQA